MRKSIIKKHCILILWLFLAALCSSHVFAMSEEAYLSGKHLRSVNIDLIQPQKNNAPKRAIHVSNEPIVLSGRVLITIPVKPKLKDAEEDRYLVEYFIDEALVYSTNGAGDGTSHPTFDWVLDTARYKNGKHKLIVNYWDAESPSRIGIKYFIIDNPVTVEDILND